MKKTPDEIKKGLECCNGKWVGNHFVGCDSECPYYAEQPFCKNVRNHDTLAYIQQLEAANAELLTKVEHLEVENKLFMETIGLLNVTENQLETKCHQLGQERDAAVADLTQVKDCDTCRYKTKCKTGKLDCYNCNVEECPCWACQFEWRGVRTPCP